MKTTFSRTFTAITVLIVTAIVILGVFFQLLVSNFLRNRAMDKLENDGKVIVELVTAYVSNSPISERDFGIALAVASSVSDADAVICNSKGQLVCCAKEPLGCEHVGMQLSPEYLEKIFTGGVLMDSGSIKGLYEDQRYLVSLPILDKNGGRIGIVLMSSPIDTTQLVMRRITEIYVFLSILVVMIAVGIMTILLRQQSGPLREMAAAARKFGHGDLSARVNTNGKCTQEIEELALAFNNMAESLEKSEMQRQDFIANVSHELKTPLHAISGYAELLKSGMVAQQDVGGFSDRIYLESQRMIRLVEDILKLSRLDEGGGHYTLEPVDLSGIAAAALGELDSMAQQRDVSLMFQGEPAMVSGVPHLLAAIVTNLTTNAIKYNRVGGKVEISVASAPEGAVLTVADTGIGIPEAHRERIFQRFYRVDKSHSKAVGGTGLGLSIVKHAAQIHNAAVELESRENEGTTIRIRFPKI